MNEAYLKQKRILLVDDEQALLDLVVSILQMDGYQRIRTAGTVADALLAAQEFQPDLAVLDVVSHTILDRARGRRGQIPRLQPGRRRLHREALFAPGTDL